MAIRWLSGSYQVLRAVGGRTSAIGSPKRDTSSHLLAEQLVAFEEIDDRLWEVYFGPVKLGRFHEQEGNIKDSLRRKARRKGGNHKRKVSPIR